MEKMLLQHCRPHITIWRMRFVCWIPEATNTHSGCVMLTAIQQQQWMHERTLAALFYFLSARSLDT